MNPVTIPATQPPRVDQVEFEMTEAERERAARDQARLERYRNEPQKRARR